MRHGIDNIFINHTEIPHDYHAIVNTSHYSEAMKAAGQIVKELVEILNEYFPDTQIIVSLGNNDVVPDYYLELKEESTPLGNTTLSVEDAGMLGVLFDALSSNLTTNTKSRSLLTPDDEWTFLRGGFYSRALHNEKLILLSLNTVLYASYFAPEPIKATDPGNQFQWMRKMLAYSRERHCQVIIIGHVPPSVGSYRHNQFWKDDYVKTYHNLVEEYDDVIIAQLFGHLHSDEFRVGDKSLANMNTDRKTHIIPYVNSPLLLGPSVTPLHGNDPTFRLVRYSRVGGDKKYAQGKFKLMDYESYRYTLNTDKFWEKLYTFSEVYNSSFIREEGLSSTTMSAIIESMEDTVYGTESPNLKSFRSYVLSGATGDAQRDDVGNDCNEKCRDHWLCTFISASSDGYDNCLIVRRESREKAKRITFLSLVSIVGIVLAVGVIVRWRRANKRSHYESTPSITCESGPEIEIEERRHNEA